MHTKWGLSPLNLLIPSGFQWGLSPLCFSFTRPLWGSPDVLLGLLALGQLLQSSQSGVDLRTVAVGGFFPKLDGFL